MLSGVARILLKNFLVSCTWMSSCVKVLGGHQSRKDVEGCGVCGVNFIALSSII